jgi:hypothetical protein
MAKTNKFNNNQVWWSILILVIIGLVAWYFNGNFFSGKTSKTTTETANTVNQTKLITGKLVFATLSGKDTTINALQSNGAVQKLFTDTASTQKITTIGALSQAPLEAPVIFNQNLLNTVKLDGSAVKQSLAQFTLDTPDVALSPDGKLISYITFSNVEKEYGFTLRVTNLDGTNMQAVFRSPYLLSSPVWAGDQKSIYYVENDGTNISIVKNLISTGQEQKIYTTADNIGSLRVLGDKIIFSQNPYEKNQSTIYLMTDSGKPQKVLLETGYIYYPTISPDGQSIAYLLSSDASAQPSGDIRLTDISGGNIKTLFKGINILGWLP